MTAAALEQGLDGSADGHGDPVASGPGRLVICSIGAYTVGARAVPTPSVILEPRVIDKVPENSRPLAVPDLCGGARRSAPAGRASR